MNLLTKVRKATVHDLPDILNLVMELAAYEKEPEAVTADLASYLKNFENGLFEAFVAEVEQNGQTKIVGMALYYYTWSTWKGKMLYLEDLVVKEEVRGAGLGKNLFDKLIAEAKLNECVMMKWQVLDWNIPAIRFYEKYEANFDKGWWNGRIFF